MCGNQWRGEEIIFEKSSWYLGWPKVKFNFLNRWGEGRQHQTRCRKFLRTSWWQERFLIVSFVSNLTKVYLSFRFSLSCPGLVSQHKTFMTLVQRKGGAWLLRVFIHPLLLCELRTDSTVCLCLLVWNIFRNKCSAQGRIMTLAVISSLLVLHHKNTTDPCCRCCSWKCRWFYLLKFYGEQSSQCDDDDDVILLLSAYLVIFLCIFRVQLSHDNGDKCMSISWNLINEVTRIRHQFIEGSSHNDQCFLLVWGYFINLKLVISAPGWNQAHCVDRGVEQTASNSTDWSNSQHCLLHQNGNPAGSSYDTT